MSDQFPGDKSVPVEVDDDTVVLVEPGENEQVVVLGYQLSCEVAEAGTLQFKFGDDEASGPMPMPDLAGPICVPTGRPLFSGPRGVALSLVAIDVAVGGALQYRLER